MYEEADKLFEKEVEEQKLAGVCWTVWKDGVRCHQKSFGMADIERGIPMKNDSIFRLYSATKPIISATVMMLVERGQLDLLDPLEWYLPAFSDMMVYENGNCVPAKRAILLQDLMNMTSGIVYPSEDVAGLKMEALYNEAVSKVKAGRPMTTIEFASSLSKAPLAFQPGESWRYGSNAEILGAVIEVVSGKKLGDFLKTNLFEPLEMQDTAFFVPADKRDRLAQIYQYEEVMQHLVPYEGDNLLIWASDREPAFQSGGAGLFSTMEDYGKFALMLLNGGIFHGKRLLADSTVHFMRQNQLTSRQMTGIERPALKGYGYGNLFRVMIDPVAACTTGSRGEFGWDGWAGVYFEIDMSRNLVLEYFMSCIGYNKEYLRRRIRNIVYAGQDEARTVLEEER